MTSLASSAAPEIIAVILPDGSPQDPAILSSDELAVTGAMMLVRHADGRLSLEPARREVAWPPSATAVMRRKPIFDPASREVVGYEMEYAVAS